MGKCAKGELKHEENPGWTSPEILSIVNRKHIDNGGTYAVIKSAAGHASFHQSEELSLSLIHI